MENLAQKVSGQILSDKTEKVIEVDSEQKLTILIEETIDRIGIRDDISKLSPEQSELFVSAFASLWKIDSIGRYVERKDSELTGGSDESGLPNNNTVGNAYDEKVNPHHRPLDWFDESVKSLVVLSSRTDNNTLDFLEDNVLNPSSKYLGDLDSISGHVLNASSLNYDQISEYVFQERGPLLDKMRSINQDLGRSVYRIPPINPES